MKIKPNFIVSRKALVISLSILSTFFCANPVFAQKSFTKAEKALCGRAIEGQSPRWESRIDGGYLDDVAKAKELGLSERQCARLTGRFNERELRGASPVKPETSASKTDSTQINLLNKNLERLRSQIRKQERAFKKLETASQTGTVETTTQYNILANQVALMTEKIQNQLDQLTNKVLTLEKGSRTDNNSKVQMDFILNAVSNWEDVIPRIERKIKRLEDRDLRVEVGRGNAATAPSGLISDQKLVESIDETGSSFSISSLNLLWLIPILLLVGAFGVIVFVLIRRNNETRLQLEQSMQYAGRQKTQNVVDEDEEKSKSEDGP